MLGTRDFGWSVEPASDQRSHVLGLCRSLCFSEPLFPRRKIRCYSPLVRIAVRIEGDNHIRCLLGSSAQGRVSGLSFGATGLWCHWQQKAGVF